MNGNKNKNKRAAESMSLNSLAVVDADACVCTSPPLDLDVSHMRPSDIARAIRPLNEVRAFRDYGELVRFGKSECMSTCTPFIPSMRRAGNRVVDQFTFETRLHTRGKYNVSFYEFAVRFGEFRERKFIQTMVAYYDNVKNRTRTKNACVVLKEIYNICVSTINIFRPVSAVEIYMRYSPTSVLDFTCGWGGRLVGACAANVPNYIGVDTNVDLAPNYARMVAFLDLAHGQHQHGSSKTNIRMFFQDARTVDYTHLFYDMVLTSPPYFNLEKYAHSENYDAFVSKPTMIAEFYEPLFRNTFNGMQIGGHYCLNVNVEIYEGVCISLFGEADEKVQMGKSQRQNDYTEFIYIWRKTTDVKLK